MRKLPDKPKDGLSGAPIRENRNYLGHPPVLIKNSVLARSTPNISTPDGSEEYEELNCDEGQ